MPFLVPAIAAGVAAWGAATGAIAAGITGALAGTGIIVTAGAVGSFIIGAALNIGVAFLARAKKGGAKADAGPQGTELRLSTDPAQARELVLGERAVAGSLVYWCIGGDGGRNLDLVIVFADHRIDSVSGVAVDGKYVNWYMPPNASGGYTQHLNEFTTQPEGEHGGAEPHVTVNIFIGTDDQTVPEELRTASGGQWTVDHRLRGCAYAWVRCRWHRSLFGGGQVPAFLWRVRGARLYDPRKDSTVPGGSGAHRFDNPATHEWTRNLEVARYNYLRGIAWNAGRPRFGPGIDAEEINLGLALAAMNACDEAVPLKAGGAEQRYSVGAVIRTDEPYKAVLDRFSAACAGTLPDLSGAYAMLPGVAQVPVLAFTDADLIAGANLMASPLRSLGEVVNEVTGDWRDPAALYQAVPIPARWSSADEDLDGDFRRSESFDTDYVASQTQGQRVLEIQRRLGRRQKSHSLTLRRRFSVLEAGDWIAWTSEIFGYVGATFRVESVTLNPGWTVTLDIREIDAGVYAWTAASDEIEAGNPADLPSAGPTLTTVEDFAIETALVESVDGTQIPAIRATWEPITDPTVVSILINYRRVGDAAWLNYRASRDQVVAGEAVITDGIVGGDFYEAQAQIITDPPRVVIVSTPVATASSTPSMIVHEAQVSEVIQTVPPASIGVDELDDRLKNAVVPGFKGADLDDSLLSALMARAIEVKQRRDLLLVSVNNARARLEQINTVLVGETFALAQAITALHTDITDPYTGLDANADAISSLTTRVDDPDTGLEALALSLTTVEAKADLASAFGSAGLVALASPAGGAAASYRITVRAGAPGQPFREAGLRVDALSAGGTRMQVDADVIEFVASRFYMIDNTGNPRTVFSAASGAIDLNSNVRVGGNLVVAGTLTVAAHAASARSQAVASSANQVSISARGGRIKFVGRIVWNQVSAVNNAAKTELWSIFRDSIQLGSNISATLQTLHMIAGSGQQLAGGGNSMYGGETVIEFFDTPSVGGHLYEIKGNSGSTLNGVATYSAEEIVI